MINNKVGFKKTSISYCGECEKDFYENEICYYTWYENDVFCYDCKNIINNRVTSTSYLKWEKRVYNI